MPQNEAPTAENPLQYVTEPCSEVGPEDKTIVLILSTMRAGSTLLKSLLGSASDVSNIPEVNFQKYKYPGAYRQMAALSEEPIVVLKHPAWVYEVRSYPRLPPYPCVKKIVLTRDVYDTVSSIRRMLFGRYAQLLQRFANRLWAERYWCRVHENMLSLDIEHSSYTTWVRYEDILLNPVNETERLFNFIGSEQKEGIASYNQPEKHTWKWGQDDGSERIRTLQVQPPRPGSYDNISLLRTIEHSPRICALRERLGYGTLPPPEGSISHKSPSAFQARGH